MKIPTCYAPEKVVSKDKERPQLANPYLDVAAESVVATDGHRLVVVPVEIMHGDVSGYLSGDMLKVARKKNRKSVEADIRDRKEIVPFDIEWPCPAEGCTFPDWQKVLPSFKPGDPGTVTIGVNARLLKGIADALGSEGEVALSFRLDSVNVEDAPESQILVRSTFAREGELGVLMPIRLGGDLRRALARPEESDDEKAAAEKRAALHDAADVLLRANGSADMTKRELTGPAEARKPKART